MISVVLNEKFNLTEPETIVEMASTSCLHQYQKTKFLFGTGTLLAANKAILTNRHINTFKMITMMMSPVVMQVTYRITSTKFLPATTASREPFIVMHRQHLFMLLIHPPIMLPNLDSPCDAFAPFRDDTTSFTILWWCSCRFATYLAFEGAINTRTPRCTVTQPTPSVVSSNTYPTFDPVLLRRSQRNRRPPNCWNLYSELYTCYITKPFGLSILTFWRRSRLQHYLFKAMSDKEHAALEKHGTWEWDYMASTSKVLPGTCAFSPSSLKLPMNSQLTSIPCPVKPVSNISSATHLVPPAWMQCDDSHLRWRLCYLLQAQVGSLWVSC